MANDPKKIYDKKTWHGRLPVLLLEDPSLSKYAKLCYGVMGSFGPGGTWAAQGTIAKRMSTSVTTVQLAQDELEMAGWITCIKSVQGQVKHWKPNLTPVPRTGGSVSDTGGPVPCGWEGACQAPTKLEVQTVNPKPIRKKEGPFPGSGGQRDPEEEGNLNPKAAPTPVPIPIPGPTPTPSPGLAPTQGGKKQSAKKVIQNILKDFEESPIGKKFQAAYKIETGFPYFFKDKDADASPNVSKLGMDDTQIDTALSEFFAPSSWYVVNGNTGFKVFVDKAQSLFVSARSKPGKSNGAPSRRYVPWDPRHPSYNPNDPVQRDQKANWEVENGLWKPKP